MAPAAKSPPALFVPLSSSQAHLPIGTRVRRGQCLIQSTLGANFIPIAPADGTIAALTEVELIGAAHSANARGTSDFSPSNAPGASDSSPQRGVPAASDSSPSTGTPNSGDFSPAPAAPPPGAFSATSGMQRPDHSSPSPGTPGEGWGGGRPTLTPALQINLDPSDIAQPTELDAPTPPASQANFAADLPHLIDKLRLAGVRAQRQTCPDLLQQLHHAMQRPIDTILCSLLDSSGGDSPLNSAVLQSAGDDLIAGLLALGKVSGANRICLVVPPNLVRRAAARARTSPASSIKIIPLANDYPQADPTLLIYALLGRRLRPDQLPPEVSCIMVDGMASVAIGRALRDEPMIRTIVQVRDSARGQSHLFWTLIGTPLHHLLEAAQIPEPDRRTLRAGSALRDVRLRSEHAIVDSQELSIDVSPQAPPINPDPCIRCGWCVEACPVRIHPAALLQAAQDNDKPMANRFGLHACIQCGICNYVCPSRLPLLQGIRSL